MSKYKKIIFILLTLFFVGLISYNYFSDYLKKVNPTSFNGAEDVVLSKGDFIIGKQIKAGFYDIESSSSVTFNGKKLSANDKLINYVMLDQSHVIIEGNGKVKFTPAEFEIIEKEANHYIVRNSGNYIIGKHLPKGEYEVSYSIKNGKEIIEKPFVQILPGFGGDSLHSYHFEKNNSFNIALEEGQVLEIHKTLFEENDQIIVNIRPF